MTPESVGPLSRPFGVTRLPERGAHVTVEATEEERDALAADLGLVALRSLVGRFRIVGKPERVHVTGRLEADITQTCVVTLDAFESSLDEEVDVEFRIADELPRRREPAVDAEIETDIDAPDEIVDGRIDLGALAAEFLALGLDPYPKKPGAEFAPVDGQDDANSPFAVLARRMDGGE